MTIHKSTDKLLSMIENARQGNTASIPIGHNKLSNFIYLAKNMYHYIAGAGGSGKSGWIDLLYIFMVYEWYEREGKYTGVKPKIILRSLERSKELRQAKWICLYLYRQHGILMDVAYLLGFGEKKSRVSDELFELIKQAKDWIDKMSDTVTLIGGVDNPTGIWLQARDYMESIGTYYRYQDIDNKSTLIKRRDKKVFKADPKECPEATKYQDIYIPDDPSTIVIHINDHLKAMSSERGFNDKQLLDKMSEYNRKLRDLYGCAIVAVNQLNRNISDTTRRVKTELLPEDSDFAGSSNLFYDCDMAMILFNPYKYNIKDLKEYKISLCLSEEGINRFRSAHVLKNTYGGDNFIFGYQFIGEVGMFRELPPPNKLDSNSYYNIANPRYKQKFKKETYADTTP